MREAVFFVLGALVASLAFLGYQSFEEIPILQKEQVASVAEEEIPETEEDLRPNAGKKMYKVVKVVDGDTVTIDIDGKHTTLRLIGLDTPETLDPRKPVHCFGAEASNKAKEMLTGTYISLETDASQDTYDKYGRLLAYIYLSDGTPFNQYMIEEGYGHEYTYNAAYKYQKQFKAAQKRAEAGEKGLWGTACSTSTQSSSPPPAPLGSYECSKNVYNCTSFKTQSEAQAAFDACGGSNNDVHKMDSDKDGSVCESLP